MCQGVLRRLARREVVLVVGSMGLEVRRERCTVGSVGVEVIRFEEVRLGWVGLVNGLLVAG